MRFSSLFLFICFVFSFKKEDIRTLEEDTSLQYYHYRLMTHNHIPHRKKSLISRSTFSGSDWLKNVDGSRTIFSLSIPGTHETCARFGPERLQCQEWTIADQLNNGVRYLDIRCRHINDCFMIHHDYVYENLGFGSGVRDVCIHFLREHPSEFILMQIKEEYQSTNNTRTFSETMQEYIKSYEDFFYLKEDVPNVDKVRGKIVILRRFKPVVADQGNLLEFEDNALFTSNTTIVARIQDCYIVPSMEDRIKKWEVIMQLFMESVQNKDQNKLFLNFGSGGSDDCYPNAVAKYTTSLIGYFLEFTRPNDFVGVILFDFVNTNYDNVIEILANRNFN